MRKLPLLFIVPLFLLSACNESGTGIFYSIGLENQYVDASLANDLTVSSFFTAGGKYFALSGSLFYRDASENDQEKVKWQTVALPGTSGSDGETSLVSSARLVGGTVYLVVTSVDGSKGGLYSFDPGATDLAGSNTTFTGPIDPDGDESTTERVASIAESGTRLVINVRLNDSTYAYYASSDGNIFSSISLPSVTLPIEEYVTCLGSDWIRSGNHLYNNATGSFAVVTASNAPGASTEGAGPLLTDLIFSSSLDALLVVSKNGTLYAHDGSAWLTPVELLSESSGLTQSAVTCLGEVTVPDDTSKTVLLFGTDRGYLETTFSGAISQEALTGATAVVPGGSEGFSTSGTDYSIVELKSSIILDISVDSNNKQLFLGTAGGGLWRSEYDAADRKWSRE